jgi:hypothetical protein
MDARTSVLYEGGQTPNSKIVAFKGSETKAKPKISTKHNETATRELVYTHR